VIGERALLELFVHAGIKLPFFIYLVDRSATVVCCRTMLAQHIHDERYLCIALRTQHIVDQKAAKLLLRRNPTGHAKRDKPDQLPPIHLQHSTVSATHGIFLMRSTIASIDSKDVGANDIVISSYP